MKDRPKFWLGFSATFIMCVVAFLIANHEDKDPLFPYDLTTSDGIGRLVGTLIVPSAIAVVAGFIYQKRG